MTDITIAVKETVREINRAALSRTTQALGEMRNAALEVLGKDGTGRVYKRGRGFHVASSPGSPPSPDTGNLRRNWQARKFVSGSLHIRLVLKSKMFYYGYLNEGTSKMAARPIEKPVKEKALPAIEKIYSNL